MRIPNFGDDLLNGAKEAGEHIIHHAAIEVTKNPDQILDTVIDTASEALDVVTGAAQEGLDFLGELFRP